MFRLNHMTRGGTHVSGSIEEHHIITIWTGTDWAGGINPQPMGAWPMGRNHHRAIVLPSNRTPPLTQVYRLSRRRRGQSGRARMWDSPPSTLQQRSEASKQESDSPIESTACVGRMIQSPQAILFESLRRPRRAADFNSSLPCRFFFPFLFFSFFPLLGRLSDPSGSHLYSKTVPSVLAISTSLVLHCSVVRASLSSADRFFAAQYRVSISVDLHARTNTHAKHIQSSTDTSSTEHIVPCIQQPPHRYKPPTIKNKMKIKINKKRPKKLSTPPTKTDATLSPASHGNTTG